MAKKEYILVWDGIESIRDELVAAAKELHDESKKVEKMDNYIYMNSMVNAIYNKSVHPECEECAAAFVKFHKLQKTAVSVHGVHIDLIRHVTIPEISPTTDMDRLNAALDRARRHARGEYTPEELEEEEKIQRQDRGEFTPEELAEIEKEETIRRWTRGEFTPEELEEVE